MNTAQSELATDPVSEATTIQQATTPAYIVVKRVNGHFEPVSNTLIQSFPELSTAIAERDKLTERFSGQTFAVFALSSQSTFTPVKIVEMVPGVKNALLP